MLRGVEASEDKLSYCGDPRLRRVGKKAETLCLWCEEEVPRAPLPCAHERGAAQHRTTCRMRGPSIFCERGFAITVQDWARYMIAARSTTFPGAYVCPVCGDRSGSVQLDKHPLLRRRRPGETTAGGIVWTCTVYAPAHGHRTWEAGSLSESPRHTTYAHRLPELPLTAKTVQSLLLPAVRFVRVCRGCHKLSSLPRYLPVNVCRCGRPNPLNEAIAGWRKMGKGQYKPFKRATPSGATSSGATPPLEALQGYVSRYTRVSARVHEVGVNGWSWIDPVIRDDECEECTVAAGDPAVIDARCQLAPQWHGRRALNVAVGSGLRLLSGLSSERVGALPEVPDWEESESSDDLSDLNPSIFNICFMCQNIGEWPIYSECPSAFVMREYASVGLATNVPLCDRCVVSCHRCGENPAILDHTESIPTAICETCHVNLQL